MMNEEILLGKAPYISIAYPLSSQRNIKKEISLRFGLAVT